MKAAFRLAVVLGVFSLGIGVSQSLQATNMAGFCSEPGICPNRCEVSSTTQCWEYCNGVLTLADCDHPCNGESCL